MAIFTEEIALTLINEGYELEAKTKKAWHFVDTPELMERVRELVYLYEIKNI